MWIVLHWSTHTVNASKLKWACHTGVPDVAKFLHTQAPQTDNPHVHCATNIALTNSLLYSNSSEIPDIRTSLTTAIVHLLLT